MAVGAEEAEIIWKIVCWIPINMIKIEGYGFPIPIFEATFRARIPVAFGNVFYEGETILRTA
jgi:hypothetical protein